MVLEDISANVTCMEHFSAVDNWQIGVLLFEMLTGRTPFAVRSVRLPLVEVGVPTVCTSWCSAVV